MSSRLIRRTTVVLGVTALCTAAFTRGVTPEAASTVQAGASVTQKIRPITLDLGSEKLGVKPKPSSESTELYDYTDPCLIPLPEIREITDEPLLFESKHGGKLTSNIADAQTSVQGPAMDYPLCSLAADVNSVKLKFGIGVKRESLKQFNARRRHDGDGTAYFNTVTASTRGLPSATAALLSYGHRGTSPQRIYSQLAVHTRSGQTVFILYSTSQSSQLHRLAAAALSTLDGSRYGIDK